LTSAQARRLREILLDPAAAFAIDPGGSARAAVLVPLHARGDELLVVFTSRPLALPRHGGQVSFPGGRVDATDVDLVATALREAHEEIGLPPAAVAVLGALRPLHVRASDFAVYPVVGAIERPSAWVPAAGEVDEVIELSVGELAASYASAVVTTPEGGQRRTPTFAAGERTIWGATAYILADLLGRLEQIERR
jgi:8-oxo-dGTP pyrophosphatase MutT (NUDIX family)